MLYFAGGYPGLYFATSMLFSSSFQLTTLEWDVPMRVVTGETTRLVSIPNEGILPMPIAATVEIPMTRGLSVRQPIPMRVTRHTMLARSRVGAELPMHVVSGGTTQPVMLQPTATVAMAFVPQLEIPTTRGMAERAEIALRITTTSTVERST